MTDPIFRMYGAVANPVQVQTNNDPQKRAVKVLGGMKINNSHIKTVRIGEDLVDVPKIEYLHLLEEQVKELRLKVRMMESRIARLDNNHNKLLSDISSLRRDLSGKVIVR